MVDPFTLDFAALRCLRMVHDLRSFSRAAESLGLGQSSVSYTIARLREVFGDPLFVRQGGGILATQRCIDIVEQVSQMLDEFEALASPRVFDPGTADLVVGISCNFYERVTILPQLTRMLRRDAPGIRLNIIPSQVRGREQLKRGESDMLIGPIRIEEAGYYRRTLFKDDYVCIMDPENSLATQSLTMEAYVATPQVVVNYGGTFRSQFLVELERLGQVPNTVMQVPSPANLPDLLASTDMIATVPRRTAAVFGQAVTVVECPVQAEISIDLQWTPRTHVSVAHVWLRSKIAEASSRFAN
ncbi:Nodulation protein D 2 [Pelagimonas phthalicica]|uniref:Nodulation protein D 2 n=1 Tax=Pelagimonas phthalicica TaxID=1037362 RepID=A0A238JHR2_9RHOB|nr:LysR family transcriptional regulator [Pelagimonas phthalicica]TDS92295.1 DNA-binding transcriptional LysR family regulator [Pelagimonas phthalicica]SMX29356.1 Nodulation protein D 2 [Pelagimonas phthalicica]